MDEEKSAKRQRFVEEKQQDEGVYIVSFLTQRFKNVFNSIYYFTSLRLALMFIKGITTQLFPNFGIEDVFDGHQYLSADDLFTNKGEQFFRSYFEASAHKDIPINFKHRIENKRFCFSITNKSINTFNGFCWSEDDL